MAKKKVLFQIGKIVSICRLEKNGYTDEGKIIFLENQSSFTVKITKSHDKETLKKEIKFIFVNNIWRYVSEGGTYSKRDCGYEIKIIS